MNHSKTFRFTCVLICLLIAVSAIAGPAPTSFAKSFTTHNVAEPLTSSQMLCRWVLIKANAANTGILYAGDSTVSTSTGQPLSAEDGIFYPPIADRAYYDLSTIYMVGTVDSDGVRVTYAK